MEVEKRSEPMLNKTETEAKVLALQWQQVHSLTERSNEFGFRFALALKNHGNVSFSPLSVFEMLSVLANAVEGETLEELLNLLKLKGMSLENMNTFFQSFNRFLSEVKENTLFETKNSIWYNPKLEKNKEFANLVKKYYDTEVNPMTSVETVNNWAAKISCGTISKIVEQVPPSGLLLADLVYFKGFFQYAFDEKLTRHGKFHGKRTSEVPFMMSTRDFPYLETKCFQGIQLKFNTTSQVLNFMSYVLLPKEGTSIDMLLKELLEKTFLLEQFTRKRITLSMPSFKIESSQKLGAALQDCGASHLLSHDFSKISKGAKISDIVERTVLVVNESGAVAASNASSFTYSHEETLHFRADKPFIFLIQEISTRMILYISVIEEL